MVIEDESFCFGDVGECYGPGDGQWDGKEDLAAAVEFGFVDLGVHRCNDAYFISVINSEYSFIVLDKFVMRLSHILLYLFSKLGDEFVCPVVNQETWLMLFFFIVAEELSQNTDIIGSCILGEYFVHTVQIAGYTFGML